MSHDHHDAIVTPTPAGFKPHTVAHHFGTATQEYAAGKFAMWLFLVTEVLLFGGLFAGYMIYKDMYPETFVAGGNQLNWQLGTLNTVFLLTSSLTMALGVRAAQLANKRQMLLQLGVTIVLAGAFMVVKYFEYKAKYDHGFLPGYLFHPHAGFTDVFAGLPFPNLYFSFYFTMTGIHGFHVLVGMFLIGWLMWGGSKGRYHSGYYMPVELVGLYWHIVDLIWIFLFPLLYLVP